MTTQIIKVYYDQNALPYKDKERTVHFPITGSTFVGSSDTTKIRFYVDGYLADENALWISVSKRADGTQGSQFLTSGTDEDGDNYREMTLSGWYTEKKGDLYISLKGYQGGSTGYWDDETGMYVVQGVPVIRATGSIKLAINYAPTGEYPYYQDEMASFQDLVAQLGNKLNITSGIKVVSSTDFIIASSEEEGQLFYSKADKKLYQLVSGSAVVFFETYDKDTLDTKFSDKVDKLTTTGKYAYTHDGSTQGETQVSEDVVNGAIPHRTSAGQLKVPAEPTDDSHATSRGYVDGRLDLKADKSTTFTQTETIELLNDKADKSDTYTIDQVDRAIASAVSSAYKYKGSVASYSNLPSSGNEVGDVYNVEDTGDNYAWTGSAWDKLAGTVDLSNYVTHSELASDLETKQDVISSLNKLDSDLVDDTNQTNKFVTASEKSTWNAKQDALVSGTNIKTIAGQSLVGSGAIDLSDYAKVDGNYPALTVGKSLVAEQIENINDEVGSTQTNPFLFQGTGTNDNTTETPTAPVAKHLELRGNSIVWNQLVNNVSYYGSALTITNSGNGVFHVSGTTTQTETIYLLGNDIAITGNKYLLKTNQIGSDSTFRYRHYDVNENGSYIFTGVSGAAFAIDFYAGQTIDLDFVVNVYDLTLLGKEYDSVLAFNRDYPLPYYSYNAGELKSCSSSKLVAIGCNQFDGELEGGYINSGTGQGATDIPNRCRTKNYIKVIAGQTYIVSCELFRTISNKNKRIRIYEYDNNYNYLGYQSSSNATNIYEIVAELSNNTHYIMIDLLLTDSTWTSNPPSQEQAQVMTRLYWDESHDFVEYVKHEYNLPSVELRSAGSVFDTITPNGVCTKRIGVYVCGSNESLSIGSTSQSDVYRWRINGLTNLVKATALNNDIANIICSKYIATSNGNNGTYGAVYGISVDTNGYVYIMDNNYSGQNDDTALKAYISGMVVYYELATPIVSEVSAFAENIEVDDFGTMEFVPSDSTEEVIVPQGNKFFYPADYVLFIDDMYNRSKDGGETSSANNFVTQSELQTAIGQIPTGDFGFPLISAPSSTSLSDDEIAKIVGGCVVNGTFLGIANPVFFKAVEIWGIYFGLVIGVVENNRQPLIQSYQIQNGTIVLRADTQQVIDIHNVNSFNGKNIPAYPSSTGTFVLKCVNGTLTWVQE